MKTEITKQEVNTLTEYLKEAQQSLNNLTAIEKKIKNLLGIKNKKEWREDLEAIIYADEHVFEAVWNGKNASTARKDLLESLKVKILPKRG